MASYLTKTALMKNDSLQSSETRTVIYLLQITGFILLLSLRNNDFSFPVHNDKLNGFQFYGVAFRKANSVWNSHWNILLLVSVTWQSLFFALHTSCKSLFVEILFSSFCVGLMTDVVKSRHQTLSILRQKKNLMKGTVAHSDENISVNHAVLPN